MRQRQKFSILYHVLCFNTKCGNTKLCIVIICTRIILRTWKIGKTPNKQIGLRSSTCPLTGFFWLLSHVIYLKLRKVLYECLLSHSWLMGRRSFSVSQQLKPEHSAKCYYSSRNFDLCHFSSWKQGSVIIRRHVPLVAPSYILLSWVLLYF